MKKTIQEIKTNGMPLEICDQCQGSGLLFAPKTTVSAWMHGSYACTSCNGLGYHPDFSKIEDRFIYGLLFEVSVDETVKLAAETLEEAIGYARGYKLDPDYDCCIYIDVWFALSNSVRVPGPTLYTYEDGAITRKEISV